MLSSCGRYFVDGHISGGQYEDVNGRPKYIVNETFGDVSTNIHVQRTPLRLMMPTCLKGACLKAYDAIAGQLPTM